MSPGEEGPRLSACLIVRDEAMRMPGTLEQLTGLADEIVVHDTGSTDRTVACAREAGAVVIEGAWTDDFAAARNVALGRASGEWVLSVDADEQVRADPMGLRSWLAEVPDRKLLVLVRNPVVDAAQGYEYTTVKLFRRDGARWIGRVHERLEHAGGSAERLRLVPPELLTIDHSGYADAGAQQRKGERNGRLAELELRDVMHNPGVQPHDVALAALNVGRSAIGAGHAQHAVDAFESVRELLDSGPLWNEATDYLARVLLGGGEAQLALVLAGQLQDGGVRADYCSWLRAQGFAQAGRPREALTELAGVEEIVDPAGRRHDPGALETLRALCRELLAAS